MVQPVQVSSEKRRMQRFSLALPSRIEFKNEDAAALQCFSRDVCACGGFFLTDNPLPMGTPVKIHIFLRLFEMEQSDITGSQISVGGTVIRTDQYGMAVRFDKRYKIAYVKD